MNTLDYVERVKLKTGIASDYGIAKLLGATRQTASGWRTGRSQLSALNCFKVAEVLGLDPAQVVADIERERAEQAGNEAQAVAWRGWVEKLGGVAAALVLGTVVCAPSPATASMAAPAPNAGPVCIM